MPQIMTLCVLVAVKKIAPHLPEPWFNVRSAPDMRKEGRDWTVPNNDLRDPLTRSGDVLLTAIINQYRTHIL
jgi:hypothetical protein